MTPASTAIDASVAVKWVLAEQHSDRADQLLVDSAQAGRTLVGPPHLTAEVVNILYRRRLRSEPTVRITDVQAEQALADFLQFPLQLLTPAALYTQAFEFARTHQLDSIYDSLYVVLAHQLGAELWTADSRLLNALRGRAPWVRFIGDYPLS